jgi:hypothetical protein
MKWIEIEFTQCYRIWFSFHELVDTACDDIREQRKTADMKPLLEEGARKDEGRKSTKRHEPIV